MSGAALNRRGLRALGPVLALLAGLLATPASAMSEDLLSAEDFEALTTGQTLFFNQSGRAYGAEQYLEDRQVIWQYGDGTCTRGVWFGSDSAICFRYEDNPTTQCWTFARRGGGFFARVQGLEAGAPSELSLAGKTTAPLRCTSPDLGV